MGTRSAQGGHLCTRPLRPSTVCTRFYETRNFPAVAFRRVLALIEDEAFRWLSSVYATLKYGSTLGNVWGLYTRVVDEKLPQLGLEQHYLTIDAGLRSSNPQDWRAALWSCRDLLHDLTAGARQVTT
jgi:hypothetical protein